MKLEQQDKERVDEMIGQWVRKNGKEAKQLDELWSYSMFGVAFLVIATLEEGGFLNLSFPDSRPGEYLITALKPEAEHRLKELNLLG
jgi:hypothetical protein